MAAEKTNSLPIAADTAENNISKYHSWVSMVKTHRTNPKLPSTCFDPITSLTWEPI
jgi:hypothetical protein